MKSKPIIFLTILIVILAFVIGFRSGQKVEKTNKVVDNMLSITPTKIPPTPTPIKYTTTKSKKWGLKFTYPSNLEIKESSKAAEVSFQLK
jgi:hypothetical protein